MQEIAKKFANRTYFIHTRNIVLEEDGSFTESGHILGDVDYVRLLKNYVENEKNEQIFFRSDHGF